LAGSVHRIVIDTLASSAEDVLEDVLDDDDVLEDDSEVSLVLVELDVLVLLVLVDVVDDVWVDTELAVDNVEPDESVSHDERLDNELSVVALVAVESDDVELVVLVDSDDSDDGVLLVALVAVVAVESLEVVEVLDDRDDNDDDELDDVVILSLLVDVLLLDVTELLVLLEVGKGMVYPTRKIRKLPSCNVNVLLLPSVHRAQISTVSAAVNESMSPPLVDPTSPDVPSLRAIRVLGNELAPALVLISTS
jgi:hypothetical protein